MLVLTRRANESIIIGENAVIEVIILSIKNNQVKIGIKAAKEIPVHRQEIYERIQSEKIKEETDES